MYGSLGLRGDIVETDDAAAQQDRQQPRRVPKNVEAEDLDIEINPETGTYRLKAKRLSTDASTVIDRAGAVQAQALGQMAETIRAVLPFILPVPDTTPAAAK